MLIRTKKVNEDQGLNDIGLGPEYPKGCRATKLVEMEGEILKLKLKRILWRV